MDWQSSGRRQYLEVRSVEAPSDLTSCAMLLRRLTAVWHVTKTGGLMVTLENIQAKIFRLQAEADAIVKKAGAVSHCQDRRVDGKAWPDIGRP